MAAPMMWNIGLAVGISLLFIQYSNGADDEKHIRTVSEKVLVDVIRENEHVLVLFYGEDCDAACEETMVELDRVVENNYMKDLKVVKSGGTAVAESYGVTHFPQLIFYRKAYPVLLTVKKIEADDVIIWMEQNREVATKTLNDDNFEHDTQASTGATTGDWFIMFYSSSRCNKLIATWEALANRFKHQMNVAVVDIDKNGELSKRFSIVECPTIKYFRNGLMYAFTTGPMEFGTLLTFADGFYRNSKSEKVPVETSPFDRLTDQMASNLKERIEGPDGHYYMWGGLGLGLFLICLCIYCVKKGKKRQTFKYD